MLIVFIAVSWFVHAIAAALIAAPVIRFGHKRIAWHWSRALVVVVPFGIWTLLFLRGPGRKFLSNLFVESLMLGGAVGLAAVIGIAIGSRLSERVSLFFLLAFLCILAAGIYWFTPQLVEQ